MSTTSAAFDALRIYLEPPCRTLSPEAARSLIDLNVAQKVQDRVEVLGTLCNEGKLTEAERAEYFAYVEGAEILALIKLMARRSLAAPGSGSGS